MLDGYKQKKPTKLRLVTLLYSFLVSLIPYRYPRMDAAYFKLRLKLGRLFEGVYLHNFFQVVVRWILIFLI